MATPSDHVDVTVPHNVNIAFIWAGHPLNKKTCAGRLNRRITGVMAGLDGHGTDLEFMRANAKPHRYERLLEWTEKNCTKKIYKDRKGQKWLDYTHSQEGRRTLVEQYQERKGQETKAKGQQDEKENVDEQSQADPSEQAHANQVHDTQEEVIKTDSTTQCQHKFLQALNTIETELSRPDCLLEIFETLDSKMWKFIKLAAEKRKRKFTDSESIVPEQSPALEGVSSTGAEIAENDDEEEKPRHTSPNPRLERLSGNREAQKIKAETVLEPTNSTQPADSIQSPTKKRRKSFLNRSTEKAVKTEQEEASSDESNIEDVKSSIKHEEDTLDKDYTEEWIQNYY